MGSLINLEFNKIGGPGPACKWSKWIFSAGYSLNTKIFYLSLPGVSPEALHTDWSVSNISAPKPSTSFTIAPEQWSRIICTVYTKTHTQWFNFKAKYYTIWAHERSRFIMEYFRPKSQRVIKLTICFTQCEPQSYVMIWTLWQLHVSMKLSWGWEHYKIKQKFLWEWQMPSVSSWSHAFHFNLCLYLAIADDVQVMPAAVRDSGSRGQLQC